MKLSELTTEKVLEAYDRTKIVPIYGSFYDKTFCAACVLSTVFVDKTNKTLKEFASDYIWPQLEELFTVDKGEDLDDALTRFYSGFDDKDNAEKRDDKYFKIGNKIRREMEVKLGPIKSVNHVALPL